MKISWKIIILLLSFLLVSCSPKCPDGEFDLVGTKWELVSLNGEPVLNSDAYQFASRVSLEFKDEYVDGHGGCNGYIRDYSLSGSEIKIGQKSFQFVTCEEPIWDQENAYHRALNRVSCVQVEGDTLMLTGWGVELVFILVE